MDGWMKKRDRNGWMDGWIDGWINKPLDGQMVSLIMCIQNIWLIVIMTLKWCIYPSIYLSIHPSIHSSSHNDVIVCRRRRRYHYCLLQHNPLANIYGSTSFEISLIHLEFISVHFRSHNWYLINNRVNEY